MPPKQRSSNNKKKSKKADAAAPPPSIPTVSNKAIDKWVKGGNITAKGLSKKLPGLAEGLRDGSIDTKEIPKIVENAQKNRFLSELEKAKKDVSQEFLNVVLSQIDEPRDLETLLEERRKAKKEKRDSFKVTKDNEEVVGLQHPRIPEN